VTARRRRPPTQNERLLKLLRAAGGRGLCQVELDRPGDGLGPIRRAASRVHELRQAGFRIEARGRRHGMAVYVLLGERQTGPSVAPGPAPPAAEADTEAPDATLFDAGVGAAPPRSPYDVEAGDQ
jgi:hypothetical protein